MRFCHLSSGSVWQFLSLNMERPRHQLCQYWPFVHAFLSAFLSALIFSITSRKFGWMQILAIFHCISPLGYYSKRGKKDKNERPKMTKFHAVVIFSILHLPLLNNASMIRCVRMRCNHVRTRCPPNLFVLWSWEIWQVICLILDLCCQVLCFHVERIRVGYSRKLYISILEE